MTMFDARQAIKRLRPGERETWHGVEVVCLTPKSWEVRGVCYRDVFGAAQALVWAVKEKS